MPDLLTGDQEWSIRETRHFLIHYRPGSPAERDMEWLATGFEKDMQTVKSYLQVDYRGKISCFIYSSIQDKRENGLVGGTTCYCMPSQQMFVAVYNPPHEVLAIGAHEIVHIVAYWTVGVHASDMLAEGIAVAVEGVYGRNTPVHSAAAELSRIGRLKSLETMFDNRAWVQLMQEDDWLYYNQAGSFVKYLVDTFGPAPFKDFYCRATMTDYRRAFSELYGRDINQVYDNWLQFLADLN
ncbi:MAG TPA: hypothetical protein ENN40_05200 [Candidatus Aminicenantes bacterium]|nr:hypothetical protein [Candidatus Aminicenantes bacterium]